MSINKLFGIALGFADRLRFSQKFIIIATLFVIPLTLLLSASVSEFNRKINHIMSQQQGLAIVDTLKENYKAINQARVVHLVNGSFDGEALVTEALGRLDQVSVQDPDQMQVIKQLKTVWHSEREKDERISVASLEYLSNHYIQAFHSLGIRSKLKFDFEAERYFLADGLLHQLPELLGLFVQLQSKSGEMIKRGKFDPDAFVAVVSLQSKVANALKENNGLIAMLNTHAKHPFVHLTEKNDQLNTSAGAFMEVMQREVIDAERLQFKFESFKVYLREVNNDLLTLYEQFYGDCLSMITENLNSTSRLRTGMFLLVGLALIFAACTITAIYIAFKGNIDKLKSSTKAIATGRLDRPVVLTSVDEIGEIGKHFNTMRITIGELILQAKKTITSVRGSAGRIKVDTAKTGIELKAQESEVNEIANSMEVMSTFIEKIAKNTDETAVKSKETNRLIKEGEHVISSTIYSIQSIAEKVDETGKAIMKLADDSNAIGSVLEVIKTIAEQTNLLALNAAIEAARAGEQGRGFAVVADEVRSLATRTQRSTEEIQDMIEKIQQSAQHTVQVMEKGMSKAEEGSKTAEEASAVLKNMTDAMQQIVLMTDSIAGSIDNQKQMANDINQKTGKVAALSREINSHAQTTAGSAQEMNELVEKLDAAVGRFSISSL